MRMKATRVLLIILLVLCLGAARETVTYIGHYLESFPGPQVYKDPNSGTLFYVETNGRHVAAISGDGRLLWSKDPFKDGRLPFYRTKKPQNRMRKLTTCATKNLPNCQANNV